MRHLKKSMAIMLALVMLLSAFPVAAFAGDAQESEATVETMATEPETVQETVSETLEGEEITPVIYASSDEAADETEPIVIFAEAPEETIPLEEAAEEETVLPEETEAEEAATLVSETEETVVYETAEAETDAETEDAASGGNDLSDWTDEQIISQANELMSTPGSQGYIDWILTLNETDRSRVVSLTGAGTQYLEQRGPVFRLRAVSADRYGDGTYAWTGSVNGTTPYYPYSLIGQTQGWSTSWLAMTRADGLAVSTLCIDPPAADPHYSGTFTAFNYDLDQRANHSDLFTEQALLIWWLSNTSEPGWQYRNALYGAAMPNLDASQALIMEHILISFEYDPNGQWNYRTNFSAASLAPITDRLNAMAQQLHDTNSFTFTDDAGVSHTFQAPEHCYWTDDQGNQRISNQVQWFIPGAGGTGNGQRNLFATPYFYEVFDNSAWVRIAKASGNTTVSGQNAGQYSLAGAVYGIYRDSACTDLITRVTTKADGSTDPVEIQMGANTSMTVYVKEISAPSGYRVDTRTYTVNLNANAHGSAAAAAVANSTDQPVTGYLRAQKASGNTMVTNNNSNYNYSDIQFLVYTDQACTTRARNAAGNTFILTTGSNGITGTAEMPLGTYWVREVESTLSGKGWEYNATPVRVTVTANNTSTAPANAAVSNRPLTGYLRALKASANTYVTDGNNNYDFSGIQFLVYTDQSCTTRARNAAGNTFTLTTNADGITGTAEMPLGTYWVREVESSLTGKGWEYNSAPTRVIVTADNTSSAPVTATVTNIPVTGYLQAVKISTNTEISEGNRLYSVAGIGFEVFTDQACTNRAINADGETFILTTDATGVTGTAEMALGTYWVREVAGSTGNFRHNATPVKVTVTADNTDFSPIRATIENEPGSAPIDVIISKIDAETGGNEPQGLATLSGAQFTVRYYDSTSASGEPFRTWVFETDDDGVVRLSEEYLVFGDDLYHDGDGLAVIPAGTITIQETAEPEGYVLDDTVYTVHFTIQENGDVTPDCETVAHGNVSDLQLVLEEQIERADVRFMKLNIDGSAMAGIPFLIERLDEDGNVIESHVIVTDENGVADTSARPKTGDSVNSLDDYVERGVFTDDSALDGSCGVWFGEQTARAEGMGSLIYANYRITELRCNANEGMDLLSQELTIADDSFEHGKVYELSSTFIDLVIHPESDLIDTVSSTKMVSIAEEISVTDTFGYDHLKTTKTYRLETEIIYVSEDGNTRQSLGSGSMTFTPAAVDATQTAYGTVENTVTVPAPVMNGGSLHAVDRLYVTNDNGDEVLLVTHNEDLSEERQTVYVPFIGTTAADAETGDHVGTCSEQAQITDVVEYHNLADGGMYVLEGTLRDAETGEVITGMDGNPCVVTKILRVNWRMSSVMDRGDTAIGPRNGEVTMPAFAFDASEMAGRTLVVTEVLYDYDTEEAMVEHYDLTDEDQQVHYPQVQTSAADMDTDDHVGALSDKAMIIDTVVLSNLIVGEAYTVSGIVMDQSTGEPLLDENGEEIMVVTDPIEADEEEIVIALMFKVNSSQLAGTTLVMFEDLIHNDVVVGTHHDILDKEQSVYFPQIATTAMANDTDDHVTGANEEVTITDVVHYSNLPADGREYTVSGYLVDQANGNPILINGEKVTAETTFVPEEMSGDVEIVFTFDGSALAGTTVVAFESLKYKDFEVAVHADIEDESQMVYIPEIRTHAYDADTLIDHTEAGHATLIDEVNYTHLLPGREYTVSGYLVDKATGKALTIDGEQITAETTFTAEASEGAVDVTFTFDASVLSGQTIVVFETLYYNGVEIAWHADIEDGDQTDFIPQIDTTAIAEDTGDHVTMADDERTIIDTVEYTGLKPNTKYIVTGILMDQATGEPVLVNGQPVTSGATFATGDAAEDGTHADGSVEIVFTFDGSALSGTQAVVFETLYQQGREVAAHADIHDDAQTVSFPEIHTTARDAATGDHDGHLDEEVTIVDEVRYTGLVPGRTYTVYGTLMDKETGFYLIADGDLVAEEVTSLTVTSNLSL